MFKPIGIVLADDQPLTRVGLRAIIQSEKAFTLLGEATTPNKIQRLCQKHQPDILLLAIHFLDPMIETSMISLYQSCPSLKVLVLVGNDHQIHLLELIASGVTGCIVKQESAEAIILAIRSVAIGGTWFSHNLALALRQNTGSGTLKAITRIQMTDQEANVLQYLTQGVSTKEVATSLHITPRTTQFHVSNLMKKLKVTSRYELIIWAKNHGW